MKRIRGKYKEPFFIVRTHLDKSIDDWQENDNLTETTDKVISDVIDEIRKGIKKYLDEDLANEVQLAAQVIYLVFYY